MRHDEKNNHFQVVRKRKKDRKMAGLQKVFHSFNPAG